MSLVVLVLVLLYHAVSTGSTCTVIGCNPDFCINTTCTKCNDAYFLRDHACFQCYLSCRNCEDKICYRCANFACEHVCKITGCPLWCGVQQNQLCDSCPDGFYRVGGLCYSCLNTGCKCSSATDCIGCLPGRYDTANSCEDKCSSGCVTCNSANNCSECVPGKYGPTCKSDCISLCHDDSCDKDSGTCPTGCPAKKYLDSKGTCQLCPNRCSSCINSTYCTSCDKYYYWGRTCAYDCTGCFGNCNRDTGCSLNCSISYYRAYNDGIHGYECIRCPENCLTCNSSTECNSCDTNYWGSYCQHHCYGCSSDCSKLLGCGSKCIHGYYSEAVDTGFVCKQCSDHCESCSTYDTCHVCQSGYFIGQNEKCGPCPANCKYQPCNETNGTCIGGCIDGMTGQQCDQMCPVHCLKCDQFNMNKCEICEIDLYGESCEHSCSINCNPANGQTKCIKSNGSCTLGCKSAYWGSKCENECSAFCASKSERIQRCNETNGQCYNGCVNGRYGENCSSKCSEYCKGGICLQQNGICKDGSVEISSTIKVSTEGQEGALPPASESSIVIPVGAGAGGAVVVAILVLILVLFLRRRRATNKGPQKDKLSPETASNNLGKEENTYATIPDSKSTADIIPEAVVLSEVPSPVTKEELKTADPNNVILSQAKMESPENLSKNDSISDGLLNPQLETKNDLSTNKQNTKKEPLVKRNGKADETENAITDTDLDEQLTDNLDEEGSTYYNTVGKHLQVSNLAQYIRSRDQCSLVEEFNKLPRGLLKDYNAAKHQKNASKNRYKMIYPYDESRVILKNGVNDYINASYIPGYNKAKEYIGSSGPFQRGTNDNGTVADFWRMVWQEKCETIVMLTKCFENKEHKCVQYWPELGQSEEYAKLNVSCVTEDQYADFTIRSFVVSRDGQTLNSHHLHFTAWPDKGVPADVTSMIEYRQKVRSLHKNAKSPMLVHCSAGIGRTGTFIVMDMLTFMGEARGHVDIFGCVANLRFHRTNLVQTPEQYEYLHHAILHALTFDCKSIAGEKFIETYSRLIKKKDGKSQLETQFQKLQSTIDEMSVEDKAAVNRNKALVDKNREGADIPGDENRVRLFENRKASASDYVNALFINGFRSRNKFIAAQTPLPATVIDFLSLIFQVKCSCVVMMEETDLQDKTVGVYWPADNQVIKHGVFQVACKESKTTSSYTVKTLSVKRKVGKKEEELDVSLFIYTNWPKDAAVPKSSDSLIQLVKDVDTKNNRQGDEKPILIHCMTGAERSCLYCAVSVLIEKMEIEHEVSVVNTLRQIKARRRSSIPTLDQYKFCHQAVISYIQTFDIYSNFGLKSK